MRVIPDELLDLVAGGATMSTETDSMPVVSVPGTPYPEPIPFFPYFPSPPSEDGGFEEPPPSYPQPFDTAYYEMTVHTSPEPKVKPAFVTMETLRDVAVQLGDIIARHDNGREHAALIFANADGDIKTTQIFVGTAEKVDIVADVPAGYKIVGWIHSHPSQPDVAGNFPSTPVTNPKLPNESDTAQVAALMKHPAADPGLQFYIRDNEYGKLWEYPGNGDINNRQVGNNVSDDTVPIQP